MYFNNKKCFEVADIIKLEQVPSKKKAVDN